MAQPRIPLPILQALLGLLCLVLLPVLGGASAQDPFSTQFDDGLMLSDLSERGAADGETCPDERSDGDGGLGDPFLPGLECRPMPGATGRSLRRDTHGAILLADTLGARHATGPPGV